jgi:chromatin segregation and condensation protein Rec8/ScpA/Scc1 (kleisin family)
MVERQALLDQWFLKQDIIDRLLASGEAQDEADAFSQRILAIASAEEGEHQSLHDPFDRSVALVLSLVREEAFDPWNVDLSQFIASFSKRVKTGVGLDLPACGRLIRLAWEVLHHQSATLFDRVQLDEEPEDWFDDMAFGWEAELDDEAFMFTQSILDGSADGALPGLFDERVRRDEGRPVTLGELLSAFKQAADDADEMKRREHHRRLHQEELAAYLADVGGRMHNEDLEGDIERSWLAMKAACAEADAKTVPLLDVMKHLQPLLEARFGEQMLDVENEAFVSSFIAGLFLTHRRVASITQEGDTLGSVMLNDLWPNVNDFSEVLARVEATMQHDAEALEGEATGSMHRLEAMAERAKKAELKAERQRVREAAASSPSEEAAAHAESEEAAADAAIDAPHEAWPSDVQAHEWLVE